MGVSLNAPVSVEGMDSLMSPVYKTAMAYLQGQTIEADSAPVYTTHLTGVEKEICLQGAEVFNREGHRITCHQPDGNGLPAAVLTFVRNTFGNNASVIKPETVKSVREKTLNQKVFYEPRQLLEEHPH